MSTLTPTTGTSTRGTAVDVPRSPLNTTYLRLDVRRVLRNRRTLIFTIVMPVVFYVIFGVGQEDAASRAYVMISLGVYGAMVAATSVGASVAVERASGWSRQLRLTPLRPATYVVTKVLAAATIALLPVAIEFVVGAASGARMPARAWVVGGVVAWLGSLVFAALGLAVGYLLPSENAMQILGAAMSVLAMLGGLFVPLFLFPHLMQQIAQFTPAYGVGILARYPLTHDGSVLGGIANVVAWAALFSVGAALLFRRDTQRV